MRSYSELILLPTFDERLNYLMCHSQLFGETFGDLRYLNQMFYSSEEWRRARRFVVSRDNGCELGVRGIPIIGRLYVHHLNPIRVDDILNGSPALVDPENMICCSYKTHKEIHYGSDTAHEEWHERTPDDTSPWKRIEV